MPEIDINPTKEPNVKLTITFIKGSKKPWKIMDNAGKKHGEAMTRAQAEEMSKGMEKYPKTPAKGGKKGVDQFMDEAIEEAPAPVKGALAKTAGKKPYTPARGRMEGEPESVAMEEELLP